MGYLDRSTSRKVTKIHLEARTNGPDLTTACLPAARRGNTTRGVDDHQNVREEGATSPRSQLRMAERAISRMRPVLDTRADDARQGLLCERNTATAPPRLGTGTKSRANGADQVQTCVLHTVRQGHLDGSEMVSR